MSHLLESRWYETTEEHLEGLAGNNRHSTNLI